jgi:CSLREA domain-containing protein
MMTKTQTTKTNHYLGMLVTLAAMAAAMLLGASPAHASTTFTVNTKSDTADTNPGDGTCSFLGSFCSLRAAIQEANANPGPDTIAFDINAAGDGLATITPDSTLPSITDTVTIDGYTQPGASPNTAARGTNAVLKIELNASNSGSEGLEILAPNSVIRGLAINRCSFHEGIGVFAAGSGSRVQGNFIGTDPSGTIDLGNVGDGVRILGPSHVIVGGTSPAARNLISGNDTFSVEIIGTQATAGSSNRVLGNLIGTDRTGTKDLGNNGGGVFISGSADNAIGGATSAGTNTIAFNEEGVMVVSGTDSNSLNGSRILRNSIFSNDSLGIDLLTNGFSGVTPNDPGDGDLGPNRQQNFPDLASARTVSGKTTISGELNSSRNETFMIRFYSNPPDTNEGKTFIGQKKITTSADGLRSFTFSPQNSVAQNRTITATATRLSTGDTSEFSALRRVTAS